MMVKKGEKTKMGTIWFRASLALLGVGAFWLAILLQSRPHGSRRKERPCPVRD